jgi:hypothetical protein
VHINKGEGLVGLSQGAELHIVSRGFIARCRCELSPCCMLDLYAIDALDGVRCGGWWCNGEAGYHLRGMILPVRRSMR